MHISELPSLSAEDSKCLHFEYAPESVWKDISIGKPLHFCVLYAYQMYWLLCLGHSRRRHTVSCVCVNVGVCVCVCGLGVVTL